MKEAKLGSQTTACQPQLVPISGLVLQFYSWQFLCFNFYSFINIFDFSYVIIDESAVSETASKIILIDRFSVIGYFCDLFIGLINNPYVYKTHFYFILYHYWLYFIIIFYFLELRIDNPASITLI